MKSERRGVLIAIGVLLLSAVLGGIYGPNVRATAASADDYQTAVRNFTRVLDVVQSNYADQVDVGELQPFGAVQGHQCHRVAAELRFLVGLGARVERHFIQKAKERGAREGEAPAEP